MSKNESVAVAVGCETPVFGGLCGADAVLREKGRDVCGRHVAAPLAGTAAEAQSE